MRWCFLCHAEFPEGTPMTLADGGTNICLGCAETPVGKQITESWQDRDRRLLPGRAGSDRRLRLARTVASYYRKGAK